MKRNAFFLTIFTLTAATGVVRANQADETPTNMMTEDITSASTVRANRYLEVRDLTPFTHVATIPADSTNGTVRFEDVKLVQVRSRVTYATNPVYCEELAFRDPGGSTFCPYTLLESSIPAYQVTYSYMGRPLASDESARRNFTFDVYFRLDELPAAVKTALTQRTRNRADLAGYFTVHKFRESVQQAVIDEARSQFCAGNYVDGMWTHSDPDCKDELITKTVVRLDDYVTVRVEAVPAQARLVSGNKGPGLSPAAK